MAPAEAGQPIELDPDTIQPAAAGLDDVAAHVTGLRAAVLAQLQDGADQAVTARLDLIVATLTPRDDLVG
jgi:hypothetical protein